MKTLSSIEPIVNPLTGWLIVLSADGPQQWDVGDNSLLMIMMECMND